MDYRTEIMKMIDRFNVESVEEFKEAENRIVADSGFRKITKKKDYDGHIRKIKSVKTKAQKINPASVQIPSDDETATELRKAFEKCLVVFSGVCDSYIQMEQALKDKAAGADIKFSQYKEINDKVRFARKSLNEKLHEMDVIYSDMVEFDEYDDDDFGDVEYRTYDSFL